jgi:hypothetical protein
MTDPNPCNAGTEHPDNYNNNTSSLKLTACVDSDIKAKKKVLVQDFHAMMKNHTGKIHNTHYIAYIRVQPMNLPATNCSCMCGCS